MTAFFLPGISIRLIQHLVAEHYGVPIETMTSAERRRAVARPRQMAMSLAVEFTPKSQPLIGRRFGGRDHSTVWYACRAVEKRALGDTEIGRDRAKLRAMLDHLKPAPRLDHEPGHQDRVRIERRDMAGLYL